MFKVTRQQIVDEALKLLNVPFRHQGRDPKTGIDCVGLPYVVGASLGYPFLNDIKGYRRVPSADDIRQTLRSNCDEIPVSDIGIGDIILMRMGGIKPRHCAIQVSDTLDLVRGLEPMMIHAKGIGPRGKVVVEPIRQWKDQFVCGFRLRGLV